MTQTQNTKMSCEFCDKRGLPLLLVRDAIAPNASTAPVSSDAPLALPEYAARYTRRVLRSGYVNVFDEARNRWEMYHVTGDGYYFRMPLQAGVIPIKPSKPFNCADLAHRAVASCITVPDPANASTVWIGFSDVIWTDAVRKKNNSRAYRQKHMVPVDVKAIMAGKPAAHCRPIAQTAAVVAEYGMAGVKGTSEFKWNVQHQFYSREGAAGRLQAECERLRPGRGQIVTVPDPVALATELALLMIRNAEFFHRDPGRKRLMAADNAVATIEAGIRDNAILKGKKQAEAAARMRSTMRPQGTVTAERIKQKVAEDLDYTAAERKADGDKAFAKYAEKFNQKEREEWQKKYAKNLAQYENKWVTPLAIKHAQLMQSDLLARHFNCNYDTRNIHSGAVYTTVVGRCSAGTQDKKVCFDLYSSWLKGNFSNGNNLVLRALVFNQDAIAKKIDEATKVSIDPRGIPWDNLIGFFNEYTKGLSSGGYDALSNFLVTYAGPIAGYFGKILNGKFGIAGAAIAFGMISKHPVIKIELTDSRLAFRKLIAKEILQRTSLQLDYKQLHQAIGAELTLQGVDGNKLNGHSSTTWLIYLDEQIPFIDQTMSVDDQTKAVLKHLRKAEDLEKLNLGRFRKVFDNDICFGILGALMQYAALTKLMEDEVKADKANKIEARVRLAAGALSLTATTADVITKVYKNGMSLRLGSGYTSLGVERMLKVTKILGVVGALIVACADLWQAYSAAKEGQYFMMTLYILGAAAGAGLAVALAIGVAVPLIGWLFVAVVSIGLMIEYFKDNKLEDWLERCPWGILPKERYPNEQVEQAAFQAALKGN